MKKKLFSILMMALCLTFTSCENENENDQLLNEYDNLIEEISLLSKKTRGDVLTKKAEHLHKQYADLLEEAKDLSEKNTSKDPSVLPKLMKLTEKAEKLQKQLDEADLTSKQTERFSKIRVMQYSN